MLGYVGFLKKKEQKTLHDQHVSTVHRYIVLHCSSDVSLFEQVLNKWIVWLNDSLECVCDIAFLSLDP